ncbi:MAG: hypothetical protein EOP51_11520 [Sphingobacteriales bacterium]|nr:MAG: hypothetical protein EOP51_11520 [Sphingobacteriales bacterium]
MKNEQLWNQFKLCLKEYIDGTSIESFNNAWISCSNRTLFYKKDMFPVIAMRMGLEYQVKEYLTVDATFYKKGNHKYQIPIVQIESENNIDSTENEIYKLCCLNAPLKILFICCDFDEHKKHQLTEDWWSYILSDFCKMNKLVGILGIVVAQYCEDGLSYNCFAYGEDGKLIVENEENVFIKN